MRKRTNLGTDKSTVFYTIDFSISLSIWNCRSIHFDANNLKVIKGQKELQSRLQMHSWMIEHSPKYHHISSKLQKVMVLQLSPSPQLLNCTLYIYQLLHREDHTVPNNITKHMNGPVNLTIPTRWAKVRPIVPVPQQMSKSNVSGPKPAQSPASAYNFSAARVLTCNHIKTLGDTNNGIISVEKILEQNLFWFWKKNFFKKIWIPPLILLPKFEERVGVRGQGIKIGNRNGNLTWKNAVGDIENWRLQM